VSQRSEQRQPTIRLEDTSRTAASQNTPSPHGMRVASATHNRFGASAVNCRLTRSGAGAARGSWVVELLRQARRRNAPCQPCSQCHIEALERSLLGVGSVRRVLGQVGAALAHLGYAKHDPTGRARSSRTPSY
jgi:hypothetical protein